MIVMGLQIGASKPQSISRCMHAMNMSWYYESCWKKKNL